MRRAGREVRVLSRRSSRLATGKSPMTVRTPLLLSALILVAVAARPQAQSEWKVLFDGSSTNAFRGYKAETMPTTFFVTVKNLFDETYIADRSRGLIPGPSRLIQAGVKYRF